MLIIFALTALGALCWLLFHLAALALPLVIGISAAMIAQETGAGLLGSGAVGFIAGVITLSAGQFLFATMRSPTLRVLTAAVFALPASIVGFSVVHRIMATGDAGDTWATIFAIIGAAITGGVAIIKVSALAKDGSAGTLLPSSGIR